MKITMMPNAAAEAALEKLMQEKWAEHDSYDRPSEVVLAGLQDAPDAQEPCIIRLDLTKPLARENMAVVSKAGARFLGREE